MTALEKAKSEWSKLVHMTNKHLKDHLKELAHKSMESSHGSFTLALADVIYTEPFTKRLQQVYRDIADLPFDDFRQFKVWEALLANEQGARFGEAIDKEVGDTQFGDIWEDPEE